MRTTRGSGKCSSGDLGCALDGWRTYPCPDRAKDSRFPPSSAVCRERGTGSPHGRWRNQVWARFRAEDAGELEWAILVSGRRRYVHILNMRATKEAIGPALAASHVSAAWVWEDRLNAAYQGYHSSLTARARNHRQGDRGEPPGSVKTVTGSTVRTAAPR